MRILAFFLILSGGLGAKAQGTLLRLPSQTEMTVIWNKGTHPTTFMDEIWVDASISKKVFIKSKLKLPKDFKSPKNQWFKTANGQAIFVVYRNITTVIYAEGDFSKYDLNFLQKRWQKSLWSLRDSEFSIFPKACAETTGGLHGRNLGPPSVQRYRESRTRNQEDVNLLECLGDGALAGLQSFRDSIVEVGRFISLLFRRPREAFNQVSEAFRETIDFVLNIRQQIRDGLQFLNDMDPHTRSVFLCRAVGQIVATVGIGALTGVGAAAALARASNSIRNMIAFLRARRGQIAEIEASNLSQDAKAEAFENLFDQIGTDDVPTPANTNAAPPANTNAVPNPRVAASAADSTPHPMAQTVTNPEVLSRMRRLGVTQDENGFIRLSGRPLPGEMEDVNRVMSNLMEQYDVQFVYRSNIQESVSQMPDGRPVYILEDQDFYNPEALELDLLGLQNRLFRAARNERIQEYHGFTIDEFGNPLIGPNADSDLAKQIRRLNQLGYEISFDRRQIPNGASGAVHQGEGNVFHVSPYLLDTPDAAPLLSHINHEMTHITTNRRNTALPARATAATRMAYAARNIEIRNASNMPEGYRGYARTDEVEARLRELPTLRQDPRHLTVAQNTELFITEQRRILSQARNFSRFHEVGEGVYRVDVPDGDGLISIQFDLSPFGELNSAQELAQIRALIDRRLEDLQRAEDRLRRERNATPGSD